MSLTQPPIHYAVHCPEKENILTRQKCPVQLSGTVGHPKKKCRTANNKNFAGIVINEEW